MGEIFLQLAEEEMICSAVKPKHASQLELAVCCPLAYPASVCGNIIF